MKKLFIIGNWKSNRTKAEANDFLKGMEGLKEVHLGEKEAIVCPPFTLLSLFHWYTQENNVPLKTGSQNVSPFKAGAYTGEVNAAQVKEFAEYTIIGHSERRTHFGETDELLEKKVEQALESGLTPIFCVQGADTHVPEKVKIVAYEPVFAIGSGNPDTPENAAKVTAEIKKRTGVPYVLYGGSVTGDNVHSFTEKDSIDGVLVGGASLTSEQFTKIIVNS